MEIEVIAKGRNMRYDAVGIYDGKGLTVLKGSRISATVASKMNPVTAASFVTGSIANGMRVWRLKDGKPLSSMSEK